MTQARGILWMVLATVLFVALDTTAKHLTQSYPVQQVVWARFTLHLVLVLVIVGFHSPRLLKSRRIGLQLVRSLFMFGANAFFFYALKSMKLVDASAVVFVGPLIITALSVPLLGERVGPRRWAAVLVGFIGAMVIVRPGPGILQSVTVLPLLAAVSFAFYQIATRVLSRHDDAMTTLLYTAVAGTVISSAVVPWYWMPPDAYGWVLFGLVGVFGAGGQLALIRAIKSAPLSTVVPFNYLTLVWATLFGYMIFGDLPDTNTVVGAVVIVAAGLYVLHREQAVTAADRGRTS